MVIDKDIGGVSSHARTDDAKASLTQGMSLTALARLFKMDKKTVGLRMEGVNPSGKRMGYPVFHIRDAASRLTPPADDDIIRLIKEMPAHRLPMKIRKEFWDAALARQKYELNAGNLWRTDQIFDVFVEVFKTLRTSINLFSDAIEREVGITEPQRNIIITMTDEILSNMSKSLIARKDLAKFGSSKNMNEDGSDDTMDYSFLDSGGNPDE
jgi:hypothetical protein